MTKADLIEEVSSVRRMPREDSEVIVEAIFERVRSLSSGNKIEIRGFGSFGTRQHPPREIPNPKTGARVEVPAKQIPYFKPSKGLKKFVNNSSARWRRLPEPAPDDRLRPDRRRNPSNSLAVLVTSVLDGYIATITRKSVREYLRDAIGL